MTRIGIVGTGNIGACNATLSIGNGFETVVVAYDEEQRQRCIDIINRNFAELKRAGKVTDGNIEAALKKLHLTFDYENLRDADFIFETVFEDVAVKKEVYEKIEAVCKRDAVIASSTSSLTAEILSVHIRHKDRFIVAHPFQPTHLQPLVELAGNRETTPETIEKAKRILEQMKRVVVVIRKELPGFIGNRLAQAMFRESLYMIEQGMASAEDIDKAVKYVVGIRYASIGLLEYFDAVGFELERDIAENVYPSLCDTKEIQQIVRDGIERGDTGLNADKGLYAWTEAQKGDFNRRKVGPFFDMFDWNLPGE
ncbi:MAG: 3-hydroxyacyl-CoA dehydrogenase family protein [Clostridiales Family XIII bacterium]|jgi:3-hydroxybutyryl-CoA dehydrogenase|nr:3-hydroxyacyl-CoA dehydrogenase family protein [Clostridiales Family XIII bacterium]